MSVTTFKFTIRGTRPGPPPTNINKTFAYNVAKFFIDLEGNGYTTVTWEGGVERRSPAGPADFNLLLTAQHEVPISLPPQQPEAVFGAFVSSLNTDGWTTTERLLHYRGPE